MRLPIQDAGGEYAANQWVFTHTGLENSHDLLDHRLINSRFGLDRSGDLCTAFHCRHYGKFWIVAHLRQGKTTNLRNGCRACHSFGAVPHRGDGRVELIFSDPDC